MHIWGNTLYFPREECPESSSKINPFHSTVLKRIAVTKLGSYLEQKGAARCEPTSLLFTNSELV